MKKSHSVICHIEDDQIDWLRKVAVKWKLSIPDIVELAARRGLYDFRDWDGARVTPYVVERRKEENRIKKLKESGDVDLIIHSKPG